MRLLTITLPVEVAIALSRFAEEYEQTHEDAVILALQEMLAALGYLDVPDDPDEETETEA